MAEYIEREALKQNIRLMPRTAHPGLVNYSTVQKVISDTPNANVVEVVRCKDCKHCEEWHNGNIWCNKHKCFMGMKPTDYCSFGELKELNNNG